MIKHQLRRYRLESFHDNEDDQAYDLQKKRNFVGQQDTLPLLDAYSSMSAITEKDSDNLSMAVQRMIGTALTRLQDPQPEGLSTRGLQAVKPGSRVLGLLSLLTLTSTLGVLLISLSYYAAQQGNRGFELFFLAGLLLIFGPNVIRLLSSTPSRLERICLLCVIGICFYLVELMISPLYVSGYDEFLHWRTASDILKIRHLFSENSMLPVSPYYPGLEIVTNALSTMSGLSIFNAGIIIISAARLLMILSLFVFYEQVTNSSRMAGIATVIYMTNPHFLFFDASFSYETLALPIATSMLCILARYQTIDKDHARWMLFSAWIILMAVTVTHHMTDYVFDGFLMLWLGASLFQTSSQKVRRSLATITFLGLVLSLSYAFLLKQNPVWGYLYDYFRAAFTELDHILAGTSTARPLFSNQAVSPTPLWDRLLMMASIGLVALGLPFGLLSLWHQHRHDALPVMLGVVSFAYPITQAFRFTNFGGEITDRSAAFLFLPVAYVLTIFITHFWPTRTLSWRAASCITCAISVILLGSVLLASGPAFFILPGPYEVVADGRSIEPEGIQAASWSFSHLGPDNRIGTDRVNQMLMSTFGDQRVVTQLDDNVDISSVFYSSHFGPEEVAILQQARVRYLVVDLRLSTGLPLIGFYFEDSEPNAYHLIRPISTQALTKFNAIPQINRVFDSGDIVIYDVGELVDGVRPVITWKDSLMEEP